jgi:hypothetical protein
MGSVPPLVSFLLMMVSGWVHRHQLIVIEFLQAENRLLKERLRGRRIRFTNVERALLARKANAVGRKAKLELDSVCFSRYAHAVASAPHCPEVELHPPARPLADRASCVISRS